MGRLEIAEPNETLPSDDQPATISITDMNPQTSTTNKPETTQDSSSSDFLINELIVGYPWTTGLFDWRENRRNAIITAFLPCVTFGQIAEVLDEGNSSCKCRSSFYCLLMFASYSQWVWSTEYRTKLRKKFKLEEDPYTDVATHIFCPCCSLCQEFRELQNRGLDPALGWEGILAQEKGRESDDEQLNVPPSTQVMST